MKIKIPITVKTSDLLFVDDENGRTYTIDELREHLQHSILAAKDKQIELMAKEISQERTYNAEILGRHGHQANAPTPAQVIEEYRKKAEREMGKERG